MQIAITIIVLLILLLPGYIAHATFCSGLWYRNSPRGLKPLVERLPCAIFLSVTIHLTCLHIIKWATGASIDIGPFFEFLLAINGQDGQSAVNKFREWRIDRDVLSDFYCISAYFLAAYAFSAIIAFAAHEIVRRSRLDLESRMCRINGDWFYLLRGEAVLFREMREIFYESYETVPLWLFKRLGIIGLKIFKCEFRAPVGVVVSAVVRHGQDDYIYWGVVLDFYFDESGNLDRLLLAQPHKCKLDICATTEPVRRELLLGIEGTEFLEPIGGEFFTLRYTEVHTLKLDYIYMYETTAPVTLPDSKSMILYSDCELELMGS